MTAVGITPLMSYVLVKEVDAGNGMLFLEREDGHQWTCMPEGGMSWSDTVRPNGAYQLWWADKNLYYCNPEGNRVYSTSRIIKI